MPTEPSVPSGLVLTRIRDGWRQVEDDLRPLYRALEPLVVFTVAAVAIALQVLVPESITSDSRYVLPIVEGVALVVLVVVGELQRSGLFQRNIARVVSILFILVMAAATAFTLFRVLDDLLGGQVHDGRALVFAGMKLWGTFVITFALVYWELDRGGPAGRNADTHAAKHLWFTQDDAPEVMGRRWAPTFLDYLYVSVTNSTAFSPTDTMPLTHTAKCLMGIQGLLSLATIAIIGARAVNIL